MIRRIVVLLIAVASCGAVYGQSLTDFKAKLSSPDSLYLSRVEVREQGNASSALNSLGQKTLASDKINIYRVNIFFDNSQDARAAAQKTDEKFKELFADIPSYLVYENPYFKLTVGNCTSSEEAIVLLGQLRSHFENAFVSRENVTLETLLD